MALWTTIEGRLPQAEFLSNGKKIGGSEQFYNLTNAINFNLACDCQLK
jgi:hypothetical protein